MQLKDIIKSLGIEWSKILPNGSQKAIRIESNKSETWIRAVLSNQKKGSNELYKIAIDKLEPAHKAYIKIQKAIDESKTQT